MSEAFQYVRELADRIGPRPATTDAEAEAADFIEDLFRSRGLDVDRDEFECPRTYTWAYVTYHALSIVSVVAVYFADLWGPLRWIALVVAGLSAFMMWLDLDTRWGLSEVVGPKGPSQNVIARHAPKSRRGERTRKIVIVAHYDSARSSLAFSPSMVKNFGLSFGLMKWCTFLVPLLILADNLPFLGVADPYLLYAAMAVAAYLLIPLLINVHRELFMHFTDGANDNASGVAALLGVMDVLVPATEGAASMMTQPLERTATGGFTPVSSGMTASAGRAAETGPVGAGSHPRGGSFEDEGDELLSYSPADVPEGTYTELPDDFEWVETGAPVKGQGAFEFESETPKPASPARVTPAPSVTGSWGDVDTDFDGDGIPDVREREERFVDQEAVRRELFGMPEDTGDEAPSPSDDSARRPEPPKRKGFFGSLGRRKSRDSEDVSSWLGVEDSFDAREEGRKIGSWDSFEEEDEDGFGFKGGWAGDDPIGDPEFAANEAHRIRRRVTESVDRSLAEKEVWFVATGAEEVGTCGMKTFLEEHADELRGALIINLDNIGTGTLHWVTKEGMARRYSSDRRLMSAARRVSREDEILVKGREYRGLSTDATPALARGYKAMSIMAFDINGRLPNWHWRSDTTDNVQPENIANAVRLVTGIIREL